MKTIYALYRAALPLLLLPALFIVLTSCLRPRSSESITKAEELAAAGDIEGAIAQYQKHKEQRLAKKDRPSWENPYFYELLIGDLELKRDRPLEALTHYELAENEKVEATLVADRYRLTASYYENRGNLKESIEVLKKYRERDQLLFDLILDRISRKLVAQEEAAEKAQNSD